MGYYWTLSTDNDLVTLWNNTILFHRMIRVKHKLLEGSLEDIKEHCYLWNIPISETVMTTRQITAQLDTRQGDTGYAWYLSAEVFYKAFYTDKPKGCFPDEAGFEVLECVLDYYYLEDGVPREPLYYHQMHVTPPSKEEIDTVLQKIFTQTDFFGMLR